MKKPAEASLLNEAEPPVRATPILFLHLAGQLQFSSLEPDSNWRLYRMPAILSFARRSCRSVFDAAPLRLFVRREVPARLVIGYEFICASSACSGDFPPKPFFSVFAHPPWVRNGVSMRKIQLVRICRQLVRHGKSAMPFTFCRLFLIDNSNPRN